MDCVQSEWQCHWCVNENKCSDSGHKCPSDNLLANEVWNETYTHLMTSFKF